METVNIKVTAATGATFKLAELSLVSGVIKYENGEISHVISEKSAGKTIEKVKPEPVVEAVVEPVVKSFTTEEPLVSPTVRSAKHKKKK